MGTEDKARTTISGEISSLAAHSRFYAITNPKGNTPVATVKAFLNENGNQALDVLSFIGDSDLVNCSVQGNNAPFCFFSDGLVFTDRYLIRTPNCDIPGLGLCYYLDTTGASNPPPCSPGQALVTDGNCYYNVLPPCVDGAVQVGSYCFRFLTVPGMGLPTRLANILLTSAKVVFIASCQTTNVFTDWWEMRLNADPGGRALVVPDVAAMAVVNANNGTPGKNQGLVDLAQGAAGYQTFIKALVEGKTAQQAVEATNTKLTQLYSPSLYTDSPDGQLPQIVYRVVGNPNVCPTGNCK